METNGTLRNDRVQHHIRMFVVPSFSRNPSPQTATHRIPPKGGTTNYWYLENKGRDWLVDLWQEYPVLNYGDKWDVT